MNLLKNHIFLNKLLIVVSFQYNWIYQFLPVKFFLTRRIRVLLKQNTKSLLTNKLKSTLGTFKDIPLEMRDSKDCLEVLKWAVNSLNHNFDILGSGLTEIDPIDWSVDFKTGIRWEKGKFYRKYKIIDLSSNSDVKVPWELSRCHHFLWLGQAYMITKDEKYASEIIKQINFWMQENPFLCSINWTCAMEVSIRAVNWLYALNMIVSSPLLTEEFSKKILESLYQHGWYIYNNLEKGYPYSANHYASNIVGLLYLGHLFDSTTSGTKWMEFSLQEYYSEVRSQILPSGVHFERSTSYHRLMTELFFYTYLFLKRKERQIPIDVEFRIIKMIDFIKNYTKHNGLSPVIGDNDDGRFLPFVKRDFNDHQYLLKIAEIVFETNYCLEKTYISNLDSHFLSADIYANKGSFYKETNNRTIFDHRDAGFVIIKDKNLYLFFSNSNLSGHPFTNKKYINTHTHADNLSFEFSYGKQDFIIDPGSFVYTASPKRRNEFKSTKKHNTIVIDELDYYGLSEKNLFVAKNNIEPDFTKVFKDRNQVKVVSRFKYDNRNDSIFFISREISVYNCFHFEIIDNIVCQRNSKIEWYFHLAQDIKIDFIDSNTLILKGLFGVILKMTFFNKFLPQIELIDSDISPSYGVISPSKAIRLTYFNKKKIKLRSKFEIIEN